MPVEKNVVAKVIETMQKEKLEILKTSLNKLSKGEGLKPKDLDEMEAEEKAEVTIKTGTLLDNLVGGGLPPKSSMLLWGEYGAGKTQICFTMAVECPDAIIYIDTEGSFRVSRVKQICEERGYDWNEVKKKIILFQPQSWVEQLQILYSFPSPADVYNGKIGLIIIDSVTNLFRGIEFAGRKTLTEKQPILREFSLVMKKLAKMFNAAFIFTTQIYESPNTMAGLPSWTSHKPVGGASLLHQPTFVIFLRRVPSSNARIARLKDSTHTEMCEVPFLLTARGVDPIPEGVDIEDKLAQKTSKYTLKQHQEKIPKKEKGKRGRPKKKPENTKEGEIQEKSGEKANGISA